jgi:excisionase family DNA binding protein
MRSSGREHFSAMGTTSAESSPESMVTAEFIARALDVGLSTVYRWAETGVVPCTRSERTVRFNLEAVKAALEARTMDALTARNVKIRDVAIARAKDTWVVDRGDYCTVVAHPGQELNRDPVWLKENFGITEDQLELLIDTPHAPLPFTVDAELEQARRRVSDLEASSRAGASAEGALLATAQADVAKAETKKAAAKA